MKVMAHRLRESERCGGCGTFPSEWLDDRGRVLEDVPYETEIIGCQGCRELAVVQEEIDKQNDRGLKVVFKVPPLHPDDDEDDE